MQVVKDDVAEQKQQYKFEIISNKQTPAVDVVNSSILNYINENYDLLQSLRNFARQTEYCVGLAANQCNLNGDRLMLRAFVYNNPVDGWTIVVNPVIEKRVGEWKAVREGSLTWGSTKRVLVNRYDMVNVKFYNIAGEEQRLLLHGEVAQVFQCVVDHLDGVEQKVVESTHRLLTANQKTGRNELCYCGSGLKFKKCHGKRN